MRMDRARDQIRLEIRAVQQQELLSQKSSIYCKRMCVGHPDPTREKVIAFHSSLLTLRFGTPEFQRRSGSHQDGHFLPCVINNDQSITHPFGSSRNSQSPAPESEQ